VFVGTDTAAEKLNAVPPSAEGPLKKYEAAVSEADAERAKSVARARSDLVAALKAAQKAALERNDGDGALTIAKFAKSYATPARPFAGITIHSTLGWQIKLLPNGMIRHLDPRYSGTWAVVGERTVAIFFNHGYVDVWHFDAEERGFKAVAFRQDREYDGSVVSR
jgi:hypothetical protein